MPVAPKNRNGPDDPSFHHSVPKWKNYQIWTRWFLGLKNFKLSGKLGEFILNWSFGGGWIGIFSMDCPGKNPLMNPVKIQINTSLKYSFVLFPCQEVYVSGWDVVTWGRASYGKQMSWRECHRSDWSQQVLPVAFSSACEPDKLHVSGSSPLTQILTHSSQKWK